MLELTDAELMARIQQGDEASFAEFVRRYQRRFYRLAFGYLHNHDESLDAVQEAFIKIYKARATWEPRANPYTWAYRIVANQCVDLLRKRKGVGAAASLDEEDSHEMRTLADTSAVDPLMLQVNKEERQKVMEAVMKLPPRQREIIILRHYEDLSLQEIAEVQGCALGTVKSSLHRAIASLRVILEGRGSRTREAV
ncbi:MAG: RNA polymerase sigma factor [Candidatus Polarisedimenticolia bacterium]